MGHQPWLDNLPDDWEPTPATPTSPAAPRSANHSRQSSLQNSPSVQNSPSRIPVPARRPPEHQSPADGKKKVTRPCHFIKREPPTPKYRSPKTPSKLRSPAPNKSKPTPKPSPPKPSSKSTPQAARKQQQQQQQQQQAPQPDTRSPLRAVSNISSQASSQNTVQIRPKKDGGGETTPEWRKRLVQGEIPSGEHRDLFAPIGLESVFKPPSPQSEAPHYDAIPMTKQSDEPHAEEDPNARDTGQEKPVDEPKDGNHHDNVDQLDTKHESYGTRSTAGSLEFQKRLLGVKKRANKARSCEDLSSQYGTHPRTASRMEDLRNEGITPITFSRSGTMNGGHFTADIIQSALKQVTTKLGNLSLDTADRPDSRASDSFLMYQESELHGDVFADDDLLDVTSHSLPQDLSMGTQESGGRRAFSNLRRGQYLGQGSFHHKEGLSPSPFPSQHLSPSVLANSRIRSSPPFYQKERVVDPPTLPRPSSANFRAAMTDDVDGTTEAMPSSGSPLKLFGDHDTFTNNKLLRRMSQFEETFGDVSGDDEPVSPSEEARRKGESRFLNVRQDSPNQPSLRRNERPRSRNGVSPPINRFGDGQLDNFDFSDTSPYEPKLVYDELPDTSRPRSQFGSSGRRYQRRTSHRDYSLDSKSTYSKLRRDIWSDIPRHAASDTGLSRRPDPNHEEHVGYVRAERSLNTPAKYPTPKRRRTILRAGSADKENQAVGENPAGLSENMSLLQKSLMQHGVEYDDYMEFLQLPSSQRPRTPTPLQTRSSAGKKSSPSRSRPKSSSNDHDAPGPLSEKAIPKVKVTGATEERRKGSITTQDFLSEATKIMDIIRANGKNTDGLPSLEEFDTEGENDDTYEEESTQEEFLRPPSREGVDMRKLREPKEPDPQVLSHLKKYEENEDLEFGVNSSAMSLRLEKDQDPDATAEDVRFSVQGAGVIEASPKGIRIHENHMDQRKRKYSTPFDNEEDSKNISARSIPTGSSQSSHAKGVLSSGLVSHLIPEQVNGLTYDRSKHQWVKERAQQSLGTPRTDDSEEDPFRDIPDLSVDELQEMMGIQLNSPEKAKDQAKEDEGDGNRSLISPKASAKPEPRPQTRDGEQSTENTSSVQSKFTRYTSSVPNSGTRATSWSTNGSKLRESSSEVEHEIQLHEGRLSKPPRPNEDNQQARVVTISFSPLVSHIAYSDGVSPVKFEPQSKDISKREEEDGSSSRPQRGRPSMLPSRLSSLDRKPFIRRPISRIDEGNEEAAEDLSLVRRTETKVSESTPIRNHTESSLVRSADRNKSYNSFHLSPLPDFTVDQIDPPLPLEVSYVAQRTHPSSLRQVHGTFALATEELVKHITEAEPFEPYWEHVRRLILREKGLITLHKLDEFCPRLEELDVSDNSIGHVTGIPSSLRTLRIQRNCLSSLTAWGHLINLQYLDVSGNELESLDGFSSLIHLRELKAHDNSIRNIDGIADLDGLLSLKLSNNSLTEIDFERMDLPRLSELDLSYNQLTSVRNLDSLRSLETLNLSFNQVTKVSSSGELSTLRLLKISNNRLSTLNVKMFPFLNLLYVDQNCLSTILGLGHCRSLEVLSAREQIADNKDTTFDIDLAEITDVRKLYLSSNKLSSRCLSPSVPLLSLQLFDIASCNIKALPGDFASSFPNIKVLNINFNSLTSVEEIANMNCLSRLGVAGNRINRLRRLCQVLSGLGRTGKGAPCSLQKVDLRGNPLTVRFYPPPITGSGRDKVKDEVKKLKDRQPSHAEKDARDLQDILGDLGPSENAPNPSTWEEEDDHSSDERDPEINDPYTLPLADPHADQKYLSHLDESTRLRRSVLELMLYAGSRGSIKYLDGLRLRPTLERDSEMDHAWAKLEDLGVLKKKAITGS